MQVHKAGQEASHPEGHSNHRLHWNEWHLQEGYSPVTSNVLAL